MEGKTHPRCARSERGRRLRRMTYVRRATIPRDDFETIGGRNVFHDVPKSGQALYSRRYPKNIVTNKNELLKGNYSYWNQPIRVFITASLLLSGRLRSYGSLAHRRMPPRASYPIRGHSRPLQSAARRRYLRSASRRSPSPDVSPTLGAPASASFLRLACVRNTPLPRGRTAPNATMTA